MTAPKLPEGLEPVAWRVDWPPYDLTVIAPERFYGADDAHRMNCHLSYVPGVAPVPEALVLLSDAQAALQALAAEKDAEIAELKEDAERWNRWLPWMRRLTKLPFDLAKEIHLIDSALALAAKEAK